ncbi:unnamed protein product [Closterium sp. NIES-53]
MALLAHPSLRGVPPPHLPPPTPLLLLLTSLVLRMLGLLLLLVGSAAAARARVPRVVAVAAGVVVGAAVEVVEVAEVVAAVGVVAGVGALVAAVVAAVGVAVVAAVGVVAIGVELFQGEVLAVARGSNSSVGVRPLRLSSFTCGKPHTQHRCFSHLDDAWRAKFGDEAERPCWPELLRSGVDIFALDYDAILAAMYALSISAEGECYRCVPPDPGIKVAALGATDPSGGQFLPILPLFSHVRRFRSAHSRVFTSPRSLRHWSGSTPVLVSPPVAPDSLVVPPPWSTLAATPSWHALPPPCFLSSQVSTSPPALACPALPSLRLGAAARRSSLLLVSSDDCSPADSPHGYPLPETVPVKVAVDSSAARGAASGGAEPAGPCQSPSPRWNLCGLPRPGTGDCARPGSEGAGSGTAKPGGVEPWGAEPAGVEPRGAEPEGVEPRGAKPGGAESGGAEPRGTASSGGPAGASPRLSPQPEPLSPQQLREWFAQRTRLRSGAAGAGDSAAGDSRAGGARAGDPMEPGCARAEGAGAGGTSAGGGGARAGGVGAGDTGAGGAGAGSAVSGGTGAGGTVRSRPIFVPLVRQVLILPSSTGLYSFTERREPESRPASPVLSVCTGRRVPRPRPPSVHGTHAMALCNSSVPLRVPLPPPPKSSLPAVPNPESGRARAASPTVSRLLPTVVNDPSFESTGASALVAELVGFAPVCRLDYATALVAEFESARPSSVGGKCALGTDVLEDRQEDFDSLAGAVPHLVAMLLAPEGDPDAPDIPTPLSYVEAITGPYFSQWQTAMDIEMASWKFTSTYVDAVPPSGANTVDGMWIFRVKRPPGSPPAFYARYVARGFSERQGVDYFQTFSPTPKMTILRVLVHINTQRDYELHSLDFSTSFLQGSLHEEIWLRRPPGFTGSFLAGTQWSLRPVYGLCPPVYSLCQTPREWHDTLRTTLAALGFTPSTTDPSLFLRNDTLLPPFYVLFYVDDLVFATANTEALTLVKSELQKRHTCTDLGELCNYLGLQITRDRARRTITLTLSHMVHQSVEPSGPYPKLVGCLMYLMTCTRPDLAYPLNLLAHYVAPDRHRKWSSQGYTFSLGSGSVSWQSTRSSSVLRSSCEAEIYAGAMAAQELRWFTYLLTDLGEQPRSPP